MAFELHDTVRIVSKPTNIVGVIGKTGFIDDVINDNYYLFSAVEKRGGVYSVIGSGGMFSQNMVADNNEEVIEGRDYILGERKANYDKLMAAVHLKNIIEDDDEV